MHANKIELLKFPINYSPIWGGKINFASIHLSNKFSAPKNWLTSENVQFFFKLIQWNIHSKPAFSNSWYPHFTFLRIGNKIQLYSFHPCAPHIIGHVYRERHSQNAIVCQRSAPIVWFIYLQAFMYVGCVCTCKLISRW